MANLHLQENCSCSNCKQDWLNTMSNLSSQDVLRNFVLVLVERESRSLDETFHIRMKRCAAAKAFKVAAERETGYKQPKRQLKLLGLR